MRAVCLRFILLGLVVLATPCVAQTASEALEREARSSFKAGRFREAALKFQESAAAATDSDRKGRMELQSAWSHYNDRNLKLSREALKRVFAADPTIDIVPDFFSPEFVSLAEEMKRSAAAPPPATEADLKELKRIAAEKLLDKMYNDVIYDLTSVPREKLDGESWELLARAYEMAGKPDAAAEARRAGGRTDTGRTGTVPIYTPALPSIPPARGSVSDFLLSGRAALERGDAFQAQAGANRAIELDPNSSEAFRLLGDSFALRGERKLAEANWQKSLQLDPKNPGTLATLADYFAGEKNPEKALELLTKLTEIDPAAYGHKLIELGRDARKAGDLPRARQIYGVAAKMIPPEAGHLNEFAIVLVLVNDLDGALVVLQAALNRQPSSAVLLCNYATVLGRKGKTAEADAEFRKALAVDQDYVPALNGLGNLLIQAGKYQEAEQLFARAFQKSSGNADATLGMARALRLSGKLREAAALLEKGPSLEDADVLNEAGAIAYDRGLFSDAVSLFERALWKKPDHQLAKSNREKAWRAADFLKGLEPQKPPQPASKPAS
ncbi:MAG: tetratricopeptide repeat protein [Acidobacteria bacterium]|nr:tetratricopeptide repeat protein [Acidobacteriota bacterium]MCG3194274.1 Lipopolysaccharide assembly protein B [Thermoanaerobaculia bacterium]